jgi:hypothetical protein
LSRSNHFAAEYYQLTEKALGVTGKVAEHVPAREIGLTLAAARILGYGAIRGTERFQIKYRAYGEPARPGQRRSRIKADSRFDTVLLVLLDNGRWRPREIWEAPLPPWLRVWRTRDRNRGSGVRWESLNFHGSSAAHGSQTRDRPPLGSSSRMDVRRNANAA